MIKNKVGIYIEELFIFSVGDASNMITLNKPTYVKTKKWEEL